MLFTEMVATERLVSVECMTRVLIGRKNREIHIFESFIDMAGCYSDYLLFEMLSLMFI
jgi:hypothetical protein